MHLGLTMTSRHRLNWSLTQFHLSTRISSNNEDATLFLLTNIITQMKFHFDSYTLLYICVSLLFTRFYWSISFLFMLFLLSNRILVSPLVLFPSPSDLYPISFLMSDPVDGPIYVLIYFRFPHFTLSGASSL